MLRPYGGGSTALPLVQPLQQEEAHGTSPARDREADEVPRLAIMFCHNNTAQGVEC